jgi:Tfp pilus assembly protein FimT
MTPPADGVTPIEVVVGVAIVAIVIILSFYS